MNDSDSRRLTGLLDAAAGLAALRRREALFRQFCLSAREAMDAELCLLYAVRPRLGAATLVTVGWCMPDADGGFWEDAFDDEPELPADPFLDGALAGTEWMQRIRQGDGWRFAFPVRDGKRAGWLLEVHSRCEPPPAVLEGMSAFVACFARLMEQWAYANLDTLTGLLNRKTFDEQFDALIAEAERIRLREDERRQVEGAKHPCWLGIVDIDHFKRINDRFGHLFGDEVLILLAECMRTVFRTTDKLFRFGGEEFVVMLRHVPEDIVSGIFERFRAEVEARDFPQVGTVSCSVGFAHIDDRLTPAELLGRADEALYYAKAHGRNQVRSYDELVMSGKIKPSGGSGAQRDADLFF